MRHREANPFWRHFAHLRDGSDLIPAADCTIMWNYDSTNKIKEVEVTFRPSPSYWENNEELRKQFRAYRRRWRSDLGNTSVDWLRSDGLNPERVFGKLLSTGFSSDAELWRALEEFGSIKECTWAREMLAELGRGTI